MKPVCLYHTLQFSPLILIATLFGEISPALAQVVPDNTLGAENSVVNPRDETSDSIDGGAIRGQNLFHSFQEFNVGADRGVYFSNPDAVSNIFSRVTGSNVSNILGTLGVDGAANLYLINPNGIIFGQNAALDVQGSFTATTADGIEFGDNGFFSAVAPGESLLTISVPLGLQFGSNPGSIINRSFVPDSTGDFVGLQVPPGENLTLVGGDVSFEAGEATARSGNIFIGGLSESGTVAIEDNGNLNFPENVARADVSLTNAADIDVTGIGGGNVTVNARNLTLEAGEFGFSLIRAGITADSNSPEAKAGDITVNATENLTINGSLLINIVTSEALGKAGNIIMTANSLFLVNGGQVNASTFGQGNAGEIKILANDNITINGKDSNGNSSGIFNQINLGAMGNTEGIKINTNSLAVTNGGQVNVNNFGQGNLGNIEIIAKNIIIIDGENNSGIANQIQLDAIGSSGNITISTNSLEVLDGAQLSTAIFGKGNAGNIQIDATNYAIFDGEDTDGNVSGAFSLVESGAEGEAGDIIINTDSLKISNKAQLSSSLFGRGEAGNINIKTNFLEVLSGSQILSPTIGQGDSGDIIINSGNSVIFDDRDDEDNINSGIFSLVESGAEGEAGDIIINTNSLKILNGAQLSSSTRGEGNAASITINTTDSVVIDGEDISGANSGIFSLVGSGAGGNGGDITISTNSLEIFNGGLISASTFDRGSVGFINITATNSVLIDGEDRDNNSSGVFSSVQEDGIGNAGGLDITTNIFTLTNGAVIDTGTLGQGKGGELKIKANSLNLDNDVSISSSSDTDFNAGNITLNITNSLNATDGLISTSSTQSSGGNITITAKDIELAENSEIGTNISFGEGSGGNITITADSIITFDDSDIFAFAPEGQGGNITLNTPAFFAENFTLNSLTANPDSLVNNFRADVNATGAVSGAVDIPDVSFIQNSLTELPNNALNTDELVANSCVVPAGDRGQGKFIITGGESLPVRPGDNLPSKYPTGEVRNVPENNDRSWQPGDPIIEPQGVYRLTNGKLVLSRECN